MRAAYVRMKLLDIRGVAKAAQVLRNYQSLRFWRQSNGIQHLP